MTGFGGGDKVREGEILCEVNGIPVLERDENGELHAPRGLGGIAAYFEAKGTPEDLYPDLGPGSGGGGKGGGARQIDECLSCGSILHPVWREETNKYHWIFSVDGIAKDGNLRLSIHEESIHGGCCTSFDGDPEQLVRAIIQNEQPRPRAWLQQIGSSMTDCGGKGRI